ncbi:hypothetical protein BH11PSE3_BH11PSE3_12670 [soil metagenome]
MTTLQIYFLVIAIGTFVVFAAGLGGSCIRYRRWLRTQPGPSRSETRALDIHAPGD